MAVCRKWIDSRNRIGQFKYTRSKLEMEKKNLNDVRARLKQRSKYFHPLPRILDEKKGRYQRETQLQRRARKIVFAQKKTINYFNAISARSFDILPPADRIIYNPFQRKIQSHRYFYTGREGGKGGKKGIVIMPGTMSARNSSYYVCTGWKCKSCWQSIMIRTWQYWVLPSHWSYHIRHLYSRWFSEFYFFRPFSSSDRFVHAG